MHPKTAGKGWNLERMVYDDGREGIAVAMFSRYQGELSLGFRWLYAGRTSEVAGRDWPVPFFGATSEWILMPHDFGRAIANVLIGKKAVGLAVEEDGFSLMLQWLQREEDLFPFIGY